MKKSLLCLGHRETLIAWSRTSYNVSKRHYRFRINCAHRFLRCHARSLRCKSKNTDSLTTPTHSAIPTLPIALDRPCALPPKQKAPTGFMTMHNLNALYFSPFVTVTEYWAWKRTTCKHTTGLLLLLSNTLYSWNVHACGVSLIALYASYISLTFQAAPWLASRFPTAWWGGGDPSLYLVS